MRTQGLNLKHHEVGEALGTLGRTTRALGAMTRLFAAHAVRRRCWSSSWR